MTPSSQRWSLHEPRGGSDMEQRDRAACGLPVLVVERGSGDRDDLRGAETAWHAVRRAALKLQRDRELEIHRSFRGQGFGCDGGEAELGIVNTANVPLIDV